MLVDGDDVLPEAFGVAHNAQIAGGFMRAVHSRRRQIGRLRHIEKCLQDDEADADCGDSPNANKSLHPHLQTSSRFTSTSRITCSRQAVCGAAP